MSALYYDRNGRPMDMQEWTRAFSQPRHVARTKITDAADPARSIDVSTVWLGIDHRFGGEGPPLIFETMAFPEGVPLEEQCERYSTEEQARQGHTAMVMLLAVEMTDPIVMDAE